MIPFKINGAKHNIPTRWEDVTYSQYVSLLTLPNTLIHQIHLFTGIPLETLENAELKNLEKIAIALSFINLSHKPQEGPANIGKYYVPKDITIESLGQFEDLRALISKRPADLKTIENNLIWCDLCLEAASIYVQKIRDGKYDSSKVKDVKEELKQYPALPIIQTGSFFFGKLLNTLTPTTTLSQNIKQRLRKLIQGLPGYQKTLDSLLPSSTQQKP